MKKWRTIGGEENRYREEKRMYRRVCEEKKKKEMERWVEEMKEVKSKKQVWKVVNRERKKKRGVNEDIEMGEWDRYFRDLLGVEDSEGRGEGEGRRGEVYNKEIGDKRSCEETKRWEGGRWGWDTK